MTMYVDPASPAGLLLRAGSMGTLLLLVGGGAVLLLVLLLSLVAGWRRAARQSGIALAAVVGLWAVSLGLSLGLLQGRTLARDGELAYCGFDCHLHVGVHEVRHGERLDVVLALRSDAKREPEYPSLLDIAVVAADGRRFAPVAGDVGGALGPGESREATLGFDVPPDADGLRLVANWSGLPEWLVPGPDQALVQRRTGIALVEAASR
jgi:hypothetical protein